MPASSTRIAAMMATIAGRPSAVQSRYTSAASSTAMMTPITAASFSLVTRLGSPRWYPPRGADQSRAAAARQQRVAVDHRLRDVHHAPGGRPRVVAQQLERLTLADPVAFHEDALRPLDHRPALER